VLQAGRSRVRFPMRLLHFSTYLKPSSRTMALELKHSLTEMSTTNLPGTKARPARKADNPTAIWELIV
jgi:hypothetical protein